MATFLLDSSVIIEALNGKRGRHLLLRDLLSRGHLLACCAINVAEVYAGLRPSEEEATGRFLRSLQFYEVSWEIARQSGLLRREYSRKGKTLALPDTTIAAVALHYGLTLITDNVKDFPMPGLQFYPLP